jgi:hypothetical protein
MGDITVPRTHENTIYLWSLNCFQVTDINMPQLKKPLTLQDATAKVYGEIYCCQGQRWLANLFQAVENRRGGYLLTANTALDECRQMADEILMIAPGILKLLSPRLALQFGHIILKYDGLNHRLMGMSGNAKKIYLSLCSAMFRSVLSRFIQNFDTDITTKRIGHLIILENLDCVPNLLEFSLSCVFQNKSLLIASKIHYLWNLQIFKYRYYCSGEIVQLLGMYCPLLTDVDIAGSAGVTNASVQHLMELRELKFLNVEGTQIDDEHYAIILSELPNIASIRFCQHDVSIISRIAAERLDTITHIKVSFLDMNKLISPSTTNISLTTDDRDLSGLTAFNALHVLTLCDLDYRRCNLTAVMRGIGHGLTDLKVFRAKRVKPRDIITLCPSLVNLSLVSSTYSRRKANRPFDPQLPHFRNLIELKIDYLSRKTAIFSFIRYYVSLKTIQLKRFSIFTFDFVREIIKLGTFKKLEVLMLYEDFPGAVTMEGLRMLLRHCPFLKRIKGVRCCKRLDFNLINELKDEIKSQNFDLEIED